MRGYFGIGIENVKTGVNIGTLFRSAHAFGADFIYVIGRRYRTQSSDTTKAYRSIPFYEYDSFDDFYKSMPKDCRLIGVEYPHKKAHPVGNFVHPERCIYLLGSEDNGLSANAINRCHYVVYIPVNLCLNVATAGSIIMYDRINKIDKGR